MMARERFGAPWMDGMVRTRVGEVPRVMTSLGVGDRLGSAKARWNIGRMQYRVPPGLYAVGAPGADAPVLVSANYKMSFDRLRGALSGRSACIECGACARNCEQAAIRVRAGVGCAAALLGSALSRTEPTDVSCGCSDDCC